MAEHYLDETTRWNITNSAQNIVSALVDPSKQFDHVFKREWSNTFSSANLRRLSSSTNPKHSTSSQNQLNHQQNQSTGSSVGGGSQLNQQQQQQIIDSEFKGKLSRYLKRLNEREYIKKCEAKSLEQEINYNLTSKQANNQLSIPDVFMMENFDLSKFKTFSNVISKVASPDSPSLLSKDQIKELQLKLTDYLDLVEEKLANQVSSRSGDFFQVMSSVDSVMDELSLAIKSVTTLRLKCSTVNESLISPHLVTIYHGRIKQNAKMVLDKLLEIVELLKVQPMIQLLLSTSDFDNALDMIGKTRIQLHKEFKFIKCLKHLEPQLVEYERLIATMMQQEEKIVHKFHEAHKKRIEHFLDLEQWEMIEVPKSFQKLITLLLDEHKSISEILEMIQEDPKSLLTTNLNDDSDTIMTTGSSSGGSVEINNFNNNNNFNNINNLNNNNINSGNNNINSNSNNNNNYNNNINNNNSYVTAMGSKYVIINSAIILIEIVLDYCKCAQNIRASSADVLEYLFQILQIYNSKTYHLVYGAGATQVAGLKTITTRCLIVSQRSLKLITLLIPILKRYFSKLLPDYTRLRRFEDIELSYQDHVDKIPNRINIIAKDVINLRLFEWEAKPPVPSQQFQAIAQHIIRLHGNIQIALPLDELILLFKMILETFKNVLIIHLNRLNIKDDPGPQKWLVTQELTFFEKSLAKLNVFKGWVLNFSDIWTRMNSSSTSMSSSSSSSMILTNTATTPATSALLSTGAMAASSVSKTTISLGQINPDSKLDTNHGVDSSRVATVSIETNSTTPNQALASQPSSEANSND